MRPVISYDIPDYTMRGVAYARQLVAADLPAPRRARTTPRTTRPTTATSSTTGEGYVIRGGNHLAGTHVMGASPRDSVVDDEQRSWDHENLYLVGGGSMPTIGTVEHHADHRRAVLPQRGAT